MTSQPLSTKQEIISNTLWRFLQLRGFVGADHRLTSWGECLASAMASLNSSDGLEEPVFIAIELMRMGVLNATSAFKNLSGAPFRGTGKLTRLSDRAQQLIFFAVGKDQRNAMLLSRVACLGKIPHPPNDWNAPLSRQLMAYQAMISTVRSSLRDLVEVCLTGLLLNGDANRDRRDWSELGSRYARIGALNPGLLLSVSSLPFVDDNDCGLGIAVVTYLELVALQKDPTAPASREECKKATQEDFMKVIDDVHGDLNLAWRLWNAVSSAYN